MEIDHEATGRRQSDDIIVRVEQQITDVLKSLQELKTWLIGDGTIGNPGMMIRIDRLEQAENSRTQHRTVLYTAIIGLLVERVFHYVSLLRK